MLYSLTVKNFAIIDNLEIQFHDGMTVLTGETGAGKSLIIDAIGLLLGKRADTDLIRFGENKAIIEGAFSYEATIGQFLSERGIDHDHESIVIKRELLSSGKSFCRVNGTLVSLGEVVELGELIGDIHSQIDTLGLVHPKNYLRFLENDAIKHDLESYQQALKQYRALKNELESLQKQAADANEKEDFLKFQIKEFELASLSIEEEQQLKQELNQLSSYETLVEQLKEFHDKVYETDAVTNLYLALQTLQKLEHIDLRFQLIRQSFEEKYYDMESILEDPILKIGNMEYDENRIEEINSRLSLYSDMRRKYKKSTAELIAYYEQIAKQIDQIDNIEGYVKALEQKVSAAYHETFAKASHIHLLREANARSLEQEMMVQFNDLQLKNTSFLVVFKDIDSKNVNFLNDGIDEVDFMVSFNKGEPKKSFAKVASGGEMSRFMLALKSIIALKMPLQMKVFDEIDQGVSGLVAYKIAEKMKSIAQTSQVLCITHLPQVASIGNHHLKIQKKVVDQRTVTLIEELEGVSRVHELASMISKGEPTLASINLASELLNSHEL